MTKRVVLPGAQSAVTEEEAQFLLDLAIEHGQGPILDLGTDWGFSALVLTQSGQSVWTIDRGFLPETIRRLQKTEPPPVIVIGSFAAVLPRLRPGWGMAFLDGDHSLEATKELAHQVLPLIRMGGVMAFHDYGRFGVKGAVDGLESAGVFKDFAESRLVGTVKAFWG